MPLNGFSYLAVKLSEIDLLNILLLIVPGYIALRVSATLIYPKDYSKTNWIELSLQIFIYSLIINLINLLGLYILSLWGISYDLLEYVLFILNIVIFSYLLSFVHLYYDRVSGSSGYKTIMEEINGKLSKAKVAPFAFIELHNGKKYMGGLLGVDKLKEGPISLIKISKVTNKVNKKITKIREYQPNSNKYVEKNSKTILININDVSSIKII